MSIDKDLENWEKGEEKRTKNWEKREAKKDQINWEKWNKEDKDKFNRFLDKEVEAIKSGKERDITKYKELEKKFLETKQHKRAYEKGRKEIEKKYPHFFD
jgi:hypothetical protein